MFADVILPLPLSNTFTYAVPTKMRDKIGKGYRVIVPFGKRKYYTAVVAAIHEKKPKTVETKEIYALIDHHPIVNEYQLKLWEWISFYYLSSLGDVYKAATPAKLRMESETCVELKNTEENDFPLTPTEKKITTYLQDKGEAKIAELEKNLKIKNVFPHIYRLTEKGIITTYETIERKYKPKTEKIISLNPEIDQKNIPELIGRAKKQKALYEQIISLLSQKNTPYISREEILKETKTSPAVLNGLIEKNILRQFSKEVSRIASEVEASRKPFPLSEHQQQAFDEICNGFADKNTCLLHGVTSSGKTEIYIHLIEKMLQEGKQTLYLVPEIALTTQLTQRLQAVFGNKLGIYHSKINDNERTEIWHKMLSDNPYEIIIGVRSSLFLPFGRLGLIIVDEEHESSYKQQQIAPRYHARDTAIVLAHLMGAKTLLGSATPAIESFYNAKKGKYSLVALTKRFEEVLMPKIIIENTKELRRKKKMKSILSPNLIDHIQQALDNEEQVILFRNRRGFAPRIECKLCAWTPKCRHCDVTLTYHKYRNELVCHYCNRAYPKPEECPACHEKGLEFIGQGTEQVEEEVSRLFPGTKVARMDTDTTHGKNAYERIISDFQNKKIRILVGTQMVSKGLDFDNVSVVGIIAADSLLNYPDFRSHERGFQLMMQASGRAGRRNKRGTVIIQTTQPELPIYRFIVENDYEGFYNMQLAERKIFKYPPFYRLISIELKDKNEQRAEAASHYFADMLRSLLQDYILLGPNKPVISKIRSYHIREILLKTENNLSASFIRKCIRQTEQRMREKREFRYVVVNYDVDPV